MKKTLWGVLPPVGDRGLDRLKARLFGEGHPSALALPPIWVWPDAGSAGPGCCPFPARSGHWRLEDGALVLTLESPAATGNGRHRPSAGFLIAPAWTGMDLPPAETPRTWNRGRWAGIEVDFLDEAPSWTALSWRFVENRPLRMSDFR